MRFGVPPPPAGFEALSPFIEEVDRRLKDAELEPHENKRVAEASWPIFRLHHQKSRHIYEMFTSGQISRDVYGYCLSQRIADPNLIAKWKKKGYERLCCLRCIQTADTSFGTNCICRVPRSKFGPSTRPFQCTYCGCRGCSG